MLLKRVIFHYFSDVPIVANNKDMILTMLNCIRIIICLLIIFAVVLPELIQDKLFNGKVLENYNAWKRTSRIIPQRNVTNQCKFTWSKQYKSMQFFKDILEAPSTVKNEKNEDIAWYWIYEHEKKNDCMERYSIDIYCIYYHAKLDVFRPPTCIKMVIC